MKRIHIAALLGLAAGAPAAALELTLNNPGFEAARDAAPGWDVSQHTGAEAYEMAIDADDAPEGKHSFRMKRTNEQVYGLIEQMVPLPGGSQGKQLEVKAKLKTRGVGPEGWVIVVNFYTPSRTIVRQVRATPLTGDSKWQEVSLRAPIPNQAHSISTGVMLLDNGTGWVDDVRVVVTDAPAAR